MFGIKNKVIRKWISMTKDQKDYDFDVLYRHGLIIRPHYAYCMFNAARLAERLGYPKVSILEFGVAGGNGLVAIEELARKIEKKFENKVEFEIYGFDTGEGLPELEGEEDLPYWFQPTQYKMDVEKLQNRLTRAQLVLGNVRDTADSFFADKNPAPIGAMFFDMDYYSSTRDSFKLFNEQNKDKYFMPRLHMYMDDVIGKELEMYGEFNGQLLAINEFNNRSRDIKIHLNQNLISNAEIGYRYQIYYAHLFNHKDYNTFIGGPEKELSLQYLKLK